MFPLTRPTLFQTPDCFIFISKNANIKNVKRRPSTKYLYFHKITGSILFISGEKNRETIKKKKSFSYLPTKIVFSMLTETQIF